MRQVLGPGLAMSMRGVKVNSQLQNVYFHDNMAESQEQLARLRTMVDDDEFNPRSVPQKQRLIYGTLRAKPLPRKGKTTDEKVLNIIRTQSPLLDLIIRQLWAYLKPTNNASKYGAKLQLLNGRWMYKMNAAGTETGRYSSKQHDFWIGTQIQNPPYKIRPMVEADAGYLFWKIDYAKSDAWFTAFESQEPALMDAVSGEKDAHCLHAAQFFKIPYEELESGWKADDPKITHNVTGIRSVTKRVGYGANYLMAGYTLFITMGYEAVVAAAKQLGYKNADNWSLKQLVQLCDYLLNVYFTELYPGLKPWIKNETIQAIARGNKATCHGGQTRTFFGNLSRDQSTQRELAAFFGQGGTAGNINQALENIYWKSDIETRGAILLLQIHDELNGLVPATDYGLELVVEINKLMENKCTLHDRTFIVPTEIEIGFGLGKRLMHWHDGITVQEIREHDRKWWQKEFPNGLAESVTERIAQTAVG